MKLQPLQLGALIFACIHLTADAYVQPAESFAGRGQVESTLFRLGSGVVVAYPIAHDLDKDWAKPMEVTRLKSAMQREDHTNVSEVTRQRKVALS